MNLNKYLLIGTLSVIATNALAEGQNIMTSKSYVDSVFQTKIPVKSLTVEAGQETPIMVPNTLVLSPTTIDGEIGETGIADWDLVDLVDDDEADAIDRLFNLPSLGDMIPTTSVTSAYIDQELSAYQQKIPKSGYRSIDGHLQYNDSSWLDSTVKGTGLVTRTSTDGVVGERKIFEESNLSGYSSLTGNNKLIADISIPTVGAMMSAISSGVSAAAPTGTANTIANYDANGALGSGIATYDGSTTYNATNDSTKIPTMAAVQRKMTCAGWPDGTTTYDSTHTDANCWLWSKD
jgi:hypothetical protein